MKNFIFYLTIFVAILETPVTPIGAKRITSSKTKRKSQHLSRRLSRKRRAIQSVKKKKTRKRKSKSFRKRGTHMLSGQNSSSPTIDQNTNNQAHTVQKQNPIIQTTVSKKDINPQTSPQTQSPPVIKTDDNTKTQKTQSNSSVQNISSLTSTSPRSQNIVLSSTPSTSNTKIHESDQSHTKLSTLNTCAQALDPNPTLTKEIPNNNISWESGLQTIAESTTPVNVYTQDIKPLFDKIAAINSVVDQITKQVIDLNRDVNDVFALTQVQGSPDPAKQSLHLLLSQNKEIENLKRLCHDLSDNLNTKTVNILANFCNNTIHDDDEWNVFISSISNQNIQKTQTEVQQWLEYEKKIYPKNVNDLTTIARYATIFGNVPQSAISPILSTIKSQTITWIGSREEPNRSYSKCYQTIRQFVQNIIRQLFDVRCYPDDTWKCFINAIENKDIKENHTVMQKWLEEQKNQYPDNTGNLTTIARYTTIFGTKQNNDNNELALCYFVKGFISIDADVKDKTVIFNYCLRNVVALYQELPRDNEPFYSIKPPSIIHSTKAVKSWIDYQGMQAKDWENELSFWFADIDDCSTKRQLLQEQSKILEQFWIAQINKKMITTKKELFVREKILKAAEEWIKSQRLGPHIQDHLNCGATSLFTKDTSLKAVASAIAFDTSLAKRYVDKYCALDYITLLEKITNAEKNWRCFNKTKKEEIFNFQGINYNIQSAEMADICKKSESILKKLAESNTKINTKAHNTDYWMNQLGYKPQPLSQDIDENGKKLLQALVLAPDPDPTYIATKDIDLNLRNQNNQWFVFEAPPSPHSLIMAQLAQANILFRLNITEQPIYWSLITCPNRATMDTIIWNVKDLGTATNINYFHYYHPNTITPEEIQGTRETTFQLGQAPSPHALYQLNEIPFAKDLVEYTISEEMEKDQRPTVQKALTELKTLLHAQTIPPLVKPMAKEI